MQKRSFVSTVPALLALLAAGACARTQAQSTPAADSPSQAVAQVGGKPITLEELDRKAAGALARIEHERYEARQQALEEMISDRLIEQAAKARGLAKDAFVKAEIEDKVPPPTDQQVADTYERHKAQLNGLKLADVADRIRRSLRDQALAERAAALHLELKRAADVKILLEEPRATVAVPAEAPSLGPAGAKVTVVEFLDYQCPYCHRAQETVDQVLKEYEGRIRFVHRDYVLGKPRSLPAARAARCAGEQGKFWDYHRGLLLNTGDLSDQDLLTRAQGLGLDPAKFTACTATDRYDAQIQQATGEGEQLGVSGTPTFFINGRRLVGALPVQQFRQLIESELRTAS